jgi:hypothetical protein
MPRFPEGSRAMGIGAGEYAKGEGFDREQNQLTVERENGECVKLRSAPAPKAPSCFSALTGSVRC